MTPSSTATSAKVIVISYYSLLTPCKGRNSVVVSHHSLTHRGRISADVQGRRLSDHDAYVVAIKV